jgi:5-hydroxyisourate hydrolase-like protein (transthyretin family)
MKKILGGLGILLTLMLVQANAIAQQSASGIATGVVKNSSGVPAAGVRIAAMAIPEGNSQGGALVSLAETGTDGRYRLENIPPGRYYIQAGFIDAPSYYPGVSTTTAATSVLVTAGSTVTGLDFTMSRGAGVRVSGRIPLSVSPRPVSIRLLGGGAPIMAAQNAAITIGADGSFEFSRVAPGNYTLTVTPGNPQLPNVPLIVGDKDITVGLAAGAGIKVSGVVGLGANSPRPANQRVILTGSTAWSQLETAINTVGQFEFPNVPAGTYSVRTIPGSASEISKLTVADRDIPGLVLPAFVQLSGRVVLDDGSALPASPIALMIEATRSNGTSVATAAGRDGAFRLPLGEGEYRISFGKLPTGLAVKSISYGPSDLLTNPLNLNGTLAPTEIQLTLQKQ